MSGAITIPRDVSTALAFLDQVRFAPILVKGKPFADGVEWRPGREPDQPHYLGIENEDYVVGPDGFNIPYGYRVAMSRLRAIYPDEIGDDGKLHLNRLLEGIVPELFGYLFTVRCTCLM